MTIQKNVASQKIEFLMVDATDFATPETGISVTAKYNKDGGGLSTCSNTVSEVTSGLYVLTLAQTETNADVVAYQMTGSGCADQWLIFYPEDGYAARISDIDSILADSTYGLDALETIVSQVKSTIDGPVDSAITQNTGLVSDVLSTIDGPVISTLDRNQNDLDSILADTGTTLENRQTSILDKTTSILTDTGTTLDNKIDSILTDTGTTLNALISDVLSTLDDPILSTLDRNQADLDTILTDTSSTLDNKLDSILADTGTTLENRQDSILNAVNSILTDTGTTLDNKVDSVLADTKTLSNATYGLSALENLVDTLESTLDGPIHSTLDAIHSSIDGFIDSAITQNTALASDILSTLDGADVKASMSEPSAGAPSASPSTGDAINYLYRVFRNKIETTSATQKVYDDAGTTVLFSCAVSDDGTTFTKDEHA